MNANNHAENVLHGNDSNAGKDVSDKEMAKALGRFHVSLCGFRLIHVIGKPKEIKSQPKNRKLPNE